MDEYRDNDKRKQTGGCPQSVFQLIAEIEYKGEEQHGHYQYETGEDDFMPVLIVVLIYPCHQADVITAQNEVQHGKKDVAVRHEAIIKESQQGREYQYGDCAQGVAYQPFVAQQSVLLCYENA